MSDPPDGMTWEQWEEVQRRSPVKNTDVEPEHFDIDANLQYLWGGGEYDG